MTDLVSDATPVTGLSVLAASYPAIVCDVWGVLHNGAVATPGAGDALAAFRRRGGRVALLTNAPRPDHAVHDLLVKTYGITPEAFDTIVTSGDATTSWLRAHGARAIHHIGPDRDLGLYNALDATLTDADSADIAVITGLFDDETETAEDYRSRLEGLAARGLTLVCANPDLIVERGGKLIPCAGAVAKVYAEMGGSVVHIGKPHRPVYDIARARLAALVGRAVDGGDILAIGDGMPTDVAGARDEGLDLLFITAGIHAHDFGTPDSPDPVRVSERLRSAGVRAARFMPRLAW